MPFLEASPALRALLYVFHGELFLVVPKSRFASLLSLGHLVDSITQPAAVTARFLFKVLVLRPSSQFVFNLLNHEGWEIFEEDVTFNKVQ